MRQNQDHTYERLPTSHTGENITGKTFERNLQFRDVLKNVLAVQYIFGQSYLSRSFGMLCFAKLFSFAMFGALTAVFVVAVFGRKGKHTFKYVVIKVWRRGGATHHPHKKCKKT